MTMYKFFKILSTIILFIFSLYYTDKLINLIKKNDPLMQTIIKKKNEYHEDPINAIITNQIIIPGISGQEIDIENSYQKMKKLGTYNENLLVYQTISPKISYQNNFDKIIIPRKNNNIALIFLIENQNIFNNINTILKNNNTIGNIINNSFPINNTNFKNTISTNSHADYCLTYNLNINNECVINKRYTILSKLKPINKYHIIRI